MATLWKALRKAVLHRLYHNSFAKRRMVLQYHKKTAYQTVQIKGREMSISAWMKVMEKKDEKVVATHRPRHFTHGDGV